MKLDTHRLLMVRAIKEKYNDPANLMRRLRKIMCWRCALTFDGSARHDEEIIRLLTEIHLKYGSQQRPLDNPLGFIHLLVELQFKDAFFSRMNLDTTTGYEKLPHGPVVNAIIYELVMAITLSNVDRWEGFIAPAKFRNKEKA